MKLFPDLFSFFTQDTTQPSSPAPKTYYGFPLDQEDWTCNQWLQYYKENKKLYGKNTAWKYLDGDISRLSMWNTARDCGFNCDFYNTLKNDGHDVGVLLDVIWCEGTNVIKGVGSGASNIGKTVKFLTSPYILVPVGLLVGYSLLVSTGTIKPINFSNAKKRRK